MNNLEKTLLGVAAVGAGAWLVSRLAARATRYDFAGKNVLITGGSRGLGLVMARQLHAEGARLSLCARDADELQRAADELAESGQRPLTVPCDLADMGQVEHMVRTIQEQRGPIDVLINNAGVIGVGPVENQTLADYHEAMNSNFFSAIHTVLAVLPQMRLLRSGRIVNISSIGGKVSMPHLLPYNASKFALTGFSEGLTAELWKDGVRVTTVCPWLMRTGSPRNANFKGRHEEEYTWFQLGDSIPLLTVSAESAARQIIAACRRGQAELILGWPAKLATLFHDLFPGLTTQILGLANDWLLPAPGGIGMATAKGHESETGLTQSFLAAATHRAEEQNNQLSPAEQAARAAR